MEVKREVNNEINELVEEIKKIAENNIVVVEVVTRTSESHYNYKVSEILVVYKPMYVKWEEPDPRRVTVISITTGAFQQYPIATPNILEEELAKDYIVERIRIY